MRQLIRSTNAYALLRAETARRTQSHTYLLVFDDAPYLRFALKEFAKLFFDAADGMTPNAVRQAELIDKELFADSIFLPEQNKKFSVADAKTVLEESTLKPVEGDKKLFVIGDFSEATPEAQNKLLKVLEEPPENVCFLLGATSVHTVLPTVLSRAQKLEIPPFSLEEETKCLHRLYPEISDVRTYAAASSGSVSTAQSFIEGGYFSKLKETAFEFAEANLFRLPVLVKETAETKYKRELISLLRTIYRDALIIKTAQINGKPALNEYKKNRAEKYLMLAAERMRLYKISLDYSLHALIYAQDALAEAEKQLKFNAVFAQCLETCFAGIYEHNTSL